MKRIGILFLFSLLTTIAISSQNIYPRNLNDSLVIITANQLKQANLIFLEHSYLLNENKILQDELKVRDDIIYDFEQIDSINTANIIKLTDEVNFNKNKVAKLETKLKNQKKFFWIGGSVLVAAIAAFFIK